MRPIRSYLCTACSSRVVRTKASRASRKELTWVRPTPPQCDMGGKLNRHRDRHGYRHGHRHRIPYLLSYVLMFVVVDAPSKVLGNPGRPVRGSRPP